MFIESLKEQLQRNKRLFIGEETAFQAAIMVPLVEVDNEWHVLFQVRSLTLRKQPGDISFPGGRIDCSDSTPLAAAIRETHEELGIDPTDIEVIGEISPYISTPSFVVYPFVAKLDQKKIIINKDEVEKVFTIPLPWLLQCEPSKHIVEIHPQPAEDFPFEKIMNGKNYQWRKRALEEYFYDYDTYTIWGLTARILKHFIEIIKTEKDGNLPF